MRCKVGDLAFIVKSVYPENIGRIVRVDGPAYFADWQATSQGAPLRGNRSCDLTAYSMTGVINDDYLRPIRPAPEEQPAPPVTVRETA